MQQGLLQQLFQFLLELLQLLFQQLDIHVPKPTPCPQPTSGITPTMGLSPTSGATPASIIPTPTVFGVSPAPSISPTSTTLPTATITPNGKVPFFVHYYIWWDSSHWKSLLGNNYPYMASPLPVPATLATDGCTATPSYTGDTIIDIPESSLGLYSQDNAAVFDTHIQEAANAGINGFVVSWAGNGQSNQTPSSTAFNSRLDSLISRVATYNTSHANKFYLMIGYEGLDNSRNPRAITWVKNDLQYFITRYSTNSVFQIPQYGTKPVLMFLDSRKFAVSDVATITSPVRSKLLLLGDEHGTTDWNRGISSYFDGDAWYFSSQDPVKNPGGFTQIKTLASTLQSQHKLWFSPLSGGYNKSNFSLGGQCVPRNNGQTMQAIYNGNKTSHPNGWMYISWNEFLENTYVEPSLRYGNVYLQKLKNIIANP